MRLSYSQSNTFRDCPQHWHWKYKEKYDPIETGSSLYFGSAVDEAVMEMLEGKKNYMDKFYTMWERSTNMFGKTTQVFDNPDVVFGHADFDEYILLEEDFKQLGFWTEELGLKAKTIDDKDADGNKIKRPETVIEIFKRTAKKKKNPYKKLTKNEKTFFSRASWLSLKRKGEILIKAFEEQFLPKIKKVHGTQLRGKITSDDGKDSIGGLLDFVADIEGFDKPVIIDLKTASQPYKEEYIDLTEQLTLYYGMKGKEYNTDLVAYVVLCKNIPKIKEAYCKKCGHKRRTGQLKTCDNEAGEDRCHGEWEEKIELSPEVQFLVRRKGDAELNALYRDYSNIMFAMKKNIIYRNHDKCTSWYGGKCPYYDLCHKGEPNGLKKRK